MSSLLLGLRSSLRAIADPARAEGARAYMKSEMPFHGVGAVPLRKTCRALFEALEFETEGAWRAAVLDLWRNAKFREERYAAVELSGIRAARAWQTMRALPMYEEMIVSGAWWDFVDAIASHRLGAILRNEPAAMRRAMLAWSRDPDLWKRRSAILCQLGFKDATDLPLLYACIEPSLGSKEFFLRKAIGWALRQYAWTDPDEVRRYVRANEERMSGLTKREALKNVGRGK
ncbi:MAG TPA: DNA alkylation repair protein [Thermoanaerobaculia bacterium]|nr:DNA alkylation repair protein [Thermoanaerobaculia bacterium]